jgi:hypothetical protein
MRNTPVSCMRNVSSRGCSTQEKFRHTAFCAGADSSMTQEMMCIVMVPATSFQAVTAVQGSVGTKSNEIVA